MKYGSEEYPSGRANYDARFPQYVDMFERIGNELYKFEPLVLDETYYTSLEVYTPHSYEKR